MVQKKSYLALKYVASITALSCTLNSHSVHASDNVFTMKEFARDYWLHGKVGEGLCGARMKPGIKEMKAAANKGNTIAAFRLGQLYEDGSWGVMQDFDEAIRWYEMAARGKNHFATLSLATIYELGRGAEKDLTKALYWFRQAQALQYDAFIAGKIKKLENELKK